MAAVSTSAGVGSVEEIVIVGGGQAGLAAAQYLQTRAGLSPLVLDSAPRLGAAWRSRWDTLHTFTSARCSSLPGLPIPGLPERYPGKDEIADYLAAYAAHFQLRVRLDRRVTRLVVVDGGFALRTADGEMFARQVVIAPGAFGNPWTPPLASVLPDELVQLHAAEYRNAAQLPPGRVLVVGAGNSGIQIAKELAADREMVLSCGRPMLELPQEVLGLDIFRWMTLFGVMDAPVAAAAPEAAMGPDPVIGNRLARLGEESNIRLVGRAVAADDGEVLTAAGERIRPDAVVWATGYRHDWSWLDPSLRDGDGQPRHDAGVGAVPGSYFLGLYRLRTRGSALLGFVGRDAERLMARVVATASAAATAPARAA